MSTIEEGWYAQITKKYMKLLECLEPRHAKRNE